MRSRIIMSKVPDINQIILVVTKIFYILQVEIGYVQYINSQTWLWGTEVKIANFLSFFCPSISKGYLNTGNNTKYRHLSWKPQSPVSLMAWNRKTILTVGPCPADDSYPKLFAM